MLLMAAGMYAQSVTQRNDASCDMVVKIYATDVGNPCNWYVTNWIGIAANTSTTYTWSQLTANGFWFIGPPTPTQEICTAYVVDFDPATSCTNLQGVGCNMGGLTKSLGTCSSCSSNTIKVDFTSTSAFNWVCHIY
jgi:hypothetical protein